MKNKRKKITILEIFVNLAISSILIICFILLIGKYGYIPDFPSQGAFLAFLIAPFISSLIISLIYKEHYFVNGLLVVCFSVLATSILSITNGLKIEAMFVYLLMTIIFLGLPAIIGSFVGIGIGRLVGKRKS